MTRKTIGLGVAVPLLCLTSLNCVTAGLDGTCIGVGWTTWAIGGHGTDTGDRVTVEGTEQKSLDLAGVENLEVQTHNGRVWFTGQSAGEPGVLKITKKAGGISDADAEAALAAMEVFVKQGGDTCKIGWQWAKTKRATWHGAVDFEIAASENLALHVTTHNGQIKVADTTKDVAVVSHNGAIEATGVGGDVTATSHNGQVVLDSCQGDVRCETHNGDTKVTGAGNDVTANTHNGTIDIAGAERDVKVTAHNGGVKIHDAGADVKVVAHNAPLTIDSCAGDLRCETHNGDISVRSAEKNVTVDTHNGSVKIAGAQGDVTLVSRNGSVVVDSCDGKFNCKTDDGGVTLTHAGEDITIVTDNGKVNADLRGWEIPRGRIETRNGAVGVALASKASAALIAHTNKGRITCDVPLASGGQSSKHELSGTIGDGRGKLNITTRNGAIKIR